MTFLIVLAILLSLTVIVLVTVLPRQNQLFSTDATSNIGKPSYWSSQKWLKIGLLIVSILLALVLIGFMLVQAL